LVTGVATIVASAFAVVVLVTAGWRAYHDQPAGRFELVAAVLLELAVLVYIAFRVADLVGGHRVAQVFILVVYLVSVALVMPAAGLIAVAERTRWGAVTLGAGALVVEVLFARVDQLWTRGG
jgi:hypothetical protein